MASVSCVSAVLGELSFLCDPRSDGEIDRRRPAAGDESLRPGGRVQPGLCEGRGRGLGGDRRAWWGRPGAEGPEPSRYAGGWWLVAVENV